MIDRFRLFLNNNIKRILFLVAYKRINITSLDLKTIKVRKTDLSYFPLSFNTILIVKHNKKVYYFRECRKHTDIRFYIDNLIDEFFIIAKQGYSTDNFLQDVPFKTSFSEEEIMNFKECLNKCKHSVSFYNTLKNVDYYLKKEKFSIWQQKISLSDATLEELNLTELALSNKPLLAYFFLYINSAIVSYKFHGFVHVGEYETFSASRSIATYIVAKSLGLERLITSSKLARLSIDGQIKYGVLCEKANGIRALDSDFKITPSLQKDLNNLQLLDVICTQYDHFANNYNVINGETNKASVCAFDNDMNKTFSPFPIVSFHSFYNGSPYVRFGLINRPYIDKYAVEAIANINIRKIKEDLAPYLTKIQISALVCRILILRKAILKSINNHKLIQLDNSEWTEETIAKEMSGEYGYTYLVQYEKRHEINQTFLNGK